MSARDQVGDPDDFLFLAQDSCTVDAPLEQVFAIVEDDRQEELLGRLSRRFAARRLLEELADGYRCETVTKGRLGGSQSFESIVWLDRPHRSVELQLGERTDLRYELSYRDDGDGTAVTCAQSYRAKRPSMASGAALSQLQRRAAEVVADRVVTIASLLG